MASFHHNVKSGKKGSASEHSAYISRKGKHSAREDLVATDYGNMPTWAQRDPSAFWKAADKYERTNGAVYREHEIALPEELTRAQQLDLVKTLIPALVGNKPYQCAVHAPNSALSSGTNTHLHLMYSDREDDGIERSPEQTFRRYNAQQPDRGGRKKASGGKNRLELRDDLIAIRKTSADLQNAALEKYGHAARVDHRSLKARGIERQPERHLGQARVRSMSQDERMQYDAQRQQHG